MTKQKKYILSIGLFLLLFGITFFYIFSNYSVTDFIETLKRCNPIFIGFAFLCVLAYLGMNCIFLKKIFHLFETKISWIQALGYTCTEIYFSAVTPSSTGGQPIELIYMARDHIPYRKSTIVVLINTILYKLAIVLLGVVSILCFPNLLLNHGILFNTLMLIGMGLNIFVILFFSLLVFSKKIPNRLIHFFLKVLIKLHIVKKEKEVEKKQEMENALKDYQKCSELTKKNPKLFLKLFSLILLQRIFLFSISFLIYRAFGLNEYSFLPLVALQIGVNQAIDSVPFPGGVMVGEGLTYQINTMIFGSTFALSSMLLVRGISFYFLILFSSFVYLCYHISGVRKEKQHDRSL